MKIKLILATAGIALLSLTACKKDYNCVCKIGIFSADAETYDKVTKKDAEERCADYEQEVQQSSSDVSCSIQEAN